jgi:hypothetical protein
LFIGDSNTRRRRRTAVPDRRFDGLIHPVDAAIGEGR